jgi:signal transduction histidine kinase
MKPGKIKLWIIGAIDIILIVISAYAFHSITEKPNLPLEINGDLTIGKTWADSAGGVNIPKDAKLISINGIEIITKDDIEFICDYLRIGEKVKLEFKSSVKYSRATAALVPFYDNFYLIVQLFVYLIFIIPAIYVLWRKPKEKASVIFHWCAMFAAFFIVFTWGKIDRNSIYADVIARLLFDFSQIMLANLLLHFAFIFPSVKWKKYKYVMIPVYLFSLRFIFLAYYNTRSVLSGNIEDFRQYLWYHLNVLETSFISIVFIALIILFHTLITTKDEVDKRKLKWVVFGVVAGTLAYIVLWQIPKFVYNEPFIPEWLMVLLTSIAPLTFSIAIIRYRVFNIDFLINKSMMYGIALLMVAAVSISFDYLISIIFQLGFDDMLGNFGLFNKYMPNISLVIGTIVAIILFEHFRKNFEGFIDRKFFKVKYNLYNSHYNFLAGLKECYQPDDVVRLLVNSTKEVIPVERIAFVIAKSRGHEIVASYTYNYDTFLSRDDIIENAFNTVKDNVLIAWEEILEDEIGYYPLEEKQRSDLNSDLVIKADIDEVNIKGILLLGRKKSRFRFTHEEIEFLKNKLQIATNEVIKIELQTELALQHEETKRLKELSELKSRFVSGVSHELKTPLTSIRMFAEMMKLRDYDREKEIEFLDIIQNECDRLNRLIENVLTYSKMEKGMKQYNFENIDLNEVAGEVLHIFKSQEKYMNFSIKLEATDYPLFAYADKDAILEMLINLVSNGIKYSGNDKQIVIKTGLTGRETFISVEDNGFGISEEDKVLLFEEFFRSKDERQLHSGGTGLGLAIVKNIMDSHGGRIELKSKKNVGSKFKLFFPIKDLELK